jgi:hypothetical protein
VCSEICDLDEPGGCSGDAVCGPSILPSGAGLCYDTCLDGVCRDGYECFDPGDGDDICLGYCESDEDCQVTGYCDVGSGLCRTPIPDVCDTPIIAGEGSYDGDTTGRESSQSLNGCFEGGLGAEDVYSITPQADGVMTVTVTTVDQTIDVALHVRTTCGDEGSQILCDDDEGDGGGETFTLDVAAGTTYFLFVDGWLVLDNGAYHLEIDLP